MLPVGRCPGERGGRPHAVVSVSVILMRVNGLLGIWCQYRRMVGEVCWLAEVRGGLCHHARNDGGGVLRDREGDGVVFPSEASCWRSVREASASAA